MHGQAEVVEMEAESRDISDVTSDHLHQGRLVFGAEGPQVKPQCQPRDQDRKGPENQVGPWNPNRWTRTRDMVGGPAACGLQCLAACGWACIVWTLSVLCAWLEGGSQRQDKRTCWLGWVSGRREKKESRVPWPVWLSG